MSTLKGQALIDFGLRGLGHPEGSCTDCEYWLSIELIKAIELLKEVDSTIGDFACDLEVTGKVSNFIKDYD